MEEGHKGGRLKNIYRVAHFEKRHIRGEGMKKRIIIGETPILEVGGKRQTEEQTQKEN